MKKCEHSFKLFKDYDLKRGTIGFFCEKCLTFKKKKIAYE